MEDAIVFGATFVPINGLGVKASFIKCHADPYKEEKSERFLRSSFYILPLILTFSIFQNVTKRQDPA